LPQTGFIYFPEAVADNRRQRKKNRGEEAPPDKIRPELKMEIINKIICGDCLEVLKTIPDCTIQTCITSPPYWGLRDYGVDGQLGLEKTPEEYAEKMVAVFREVRRVLKDDGTLWLNLGDSYASGKGTCYNPGGGSSSLGKERKEVGAHPLDRGNKSTLSESGLKPKDLVGIPWMMAFALRADGWYLRSDIIWSKPNPMPESVTDRPTKAHEYLFLLSKSAKYYYDADAIREPHQADSGWSKQRATGKCRSRINEKTTGMLSKERDDKTRYLPMLDNVLGRNKRTVWTIATQPFPEAHFAVMPEKLVEPCVLAGSREGDIVLDPFCGAGTVPKVAKEFQRSYLGIELSPEYCKIAEDRLKQGVLEG